MLHHSPAPLVHSFISCSQVARLSGPVPPEAPGSKVTAVSEVGVGEHGVFLPHRAEAFDRVHELLVVHEL